MSKNYRLLIGGEWVDGANGTSPVINPKGEIIARYDKMFPFYPYEEGITPGSAFCVFEVENRDFPKMAKKHDF